MDRSQRNGIFEITGEDGLKQAFITGHIQSSIGQTRQLAIPLPRRSAISTGLLATADEPIAISSASTGVRPPSKHDSSEISVDLEGIAKVHTEVVLPKLRALLTQDALNVYLPSMHQPVLHEMYEATYLNLIVQAVSNNFAAISDFPLHQLFDYVQHRLPQISRSLASTWAPIFKAFAEKLFTCAIEAGNAEMVDRLLSDRRFTLDANRHVIRERWSVSRYTPVERSIQLRDFPVTRVLLKHRADVHRRHGRFHLGGPLYYAIGGHYLGRDGFPKRTDLALLGLLMEAGAPVERGRIGDAIEAREADVVELLIRHCAHDWAELLPTSSSYDTWTDSQILLQAVKQLPAESALRIVNIMLEVGADINSWAGDAQASILLYGEPSPHSVIDAAAKRGNAELLTRLRVLGACLTAETLTFAIRSLNLELVDYLINEGADVDEVDSFGSTPIAEAIRLGELDLVQLLRHKGARYEEKQRYCAAINAAAESGNFGVIQTLLDIEIAEPDGPDTLDTYNLDSDSTRADILGSALVKAMSAHHREIACLLIDAGANVDCTSKPYGKETPIYWALELRDADLLKKLLDADADLDCVSSAISLAVEWGDMSIISNLLLAGARVYDGGGCYDFNPPLVMAIEMGNLPLVELLLAAGANVNLMREEYEDMRDTTALVAAVVQNHVEMIQKLFAYGANPADYSAIWDALQSRRSCLALLLNEYKKQYPRGNTAVGTKLLQSAIKEGEVDLVKLLLDHRIGLENIVSDESYLETPVGKALSTKTSARVEIVSMLIEAGVDPNAVVAKWRDIDCHSSSRATALLHAISTNDCAIVGLMISLGAWVHWPASRGVKRTPLQAAAEIGNRDMVQLLLQNGADPNEPPARINGGTALQLAACGGYAGIVELLLYVGADVNGPTSKADGRSVVEGAAEHGRLVMLKFLLDNGGLLEYPTNGWENRATRLAKRNGHCAVAEFLQSYLAEHPVPNAPEPESREPDNADEAGRSQAIICGRCSTSFSVQSALRRHEQTVHPAPNKLPEHECQTCNRLFSRKDTLERHKASHTKERYVPCTGCGEKFRKDYLKTHLRACGNGGRRDADSST